MADKKLSTKIVQFHFFRYFRQRERRCFTTDSATFLTFMQHLPIGEHLNQRTENLDQNRMEELLALCKKGDRRAQKKLYDSLAPKMFALCIRYMGDRESAADVLQDGFVTLFSKLDTFSGEGSFEGWVRRIFVNTALMSLRKNDILRNTKELEDAAPVVSEASSALDDIGYKELMAMVASLPTGFRTVFNMYVIEGFSHKDIADALGISEATSRSQLLRGRTILQDMIRKRR